MSVHNRYGYAHFQCVWERCFATLKNRTGPGQARWLITGLFAADRSPYPAAACCRKGAGDIEPLV